MKIGIIGLPQSGKTTVFKILLHKDASGNIGVFKAEDYRVEAICRIFSSKKMSYPEFTFVDIGPTSTFTKKDLAQLQDMDLFICVVAMFFSEDPKKDFENSLTDIIIRDLELVQNRLARLQKEARSADSEQASKVLERCLASFSDGTPLRDAGLTKEDMRLLSGLVLLSLRPLILAINMPEGPSEDLEERVKSLEAYCRSKDMRPIRFFGKAELELLELEPEEREKFLKELGAGYDFRKDISGLILKELDLITFFTSGDKETRGWYLKRGLPAVEAAGKIHSDMKRGFIRAEVVSFEDFIKCGAMHKAREKGLLKLEGKDYIVKDGDILNIRFNV